MSDQEVAVGVWAEFEEKEFETLANAAFVSEQVLQGRKVQLFSPGQVLEKTLGFDFATNVGRHSAITRRLFGAAPGATGSTSRQLSGMGVPFTPTTRFLNLFIQYKRPEHFSNGHRSPLWSSTDQFLRFTVSENYTQGGGHHFDQITALSSLASVLGSSAVVRYSCPSVWTKRDLYGLFADGRLLENCAFVDPRRLAHPTSTSGFHRRWTYQHGKTQQGKPNPGGEFTPAQDVYQLAEEFVAIAQDRPTMTRYTSEVATIAEDANKVRGLVEARKAKLGRRDVARTDREDASIKRDLLKVGPIEQQSVEASLGVAGIARDLGVQWNIVTVE